MNEQLPDGWVEVELGQVCTFNYGKSLPEKIRVSGNYSVYGSNGIVGTHESFLIEGPTIIIGRKGSAGAVHFSAESCFPIDTTYYVKQTAGVDLKFLYYFLKSADLTSLETSSAVPGLNRNSAYVLDFPLPPLAEQARIVTALDGLLGRVRMAQEQLATVPKLLKRFRQGILSAAVSGKLTEDWREENPDVVDDSVFNYLKNLDVYDAEGIKFPIPDSWTVARSGNIFEFVTSGSRGWAQYYSDKGPIFIRITNLDYDTLKIDLSEGKLQFVNPPKNAEGTRTRVRKDDLLISITGEVGMVGLVSEDIGEAYINQHIALARPIKGLEVNYLGISLSAQNGGIAQVKEMAKGATKAGLTLSDIRNLAIPIPSFTEQREIVERVKNLLALADKLEEGYKAAKRQLDAMPAATLAKAFTGELTEQDPADEPASVLLERIRARRLADQQRPNPKKIPMTEKAPKQPKPMAEQLRSIKEILTITNAPVSAHTVWQQSVHKDDIEAFYADLKQLVDVDGSVIDIKEGEQSYLKLADAD